MSEELAPSRVKHAYGTVSWLYPREENLPDIYIYADLEKILLKL